MFSVIKYIGQKDIDLLEEVKILGIDVYCEPFAGSFNTGFRLIDTGYKAKYILNDLDEKIYNFWVKLKFKPKRLSMKIFSLLDKMEKINNNAFNSDSELIKLLETKSESPNAIESAAAEFLIHQTKTLSGFSYNKYRIENSVSEYDFSIDSEYLYQTQIYNKDYKYIFDKYDSKTTFFFIDPPYMNKRTKNYYRYGNQDFNHNELCKRIKRLKGRWLLTYDYNEKLIEMYKDYNIEIVERPMMGKVYKELYIRNYKI